MASRPSRSRTLVALLALLAVTQAASADSSRPTGQRVFGRHGFAGGFALGPSLFLGRGQLDTVQNLGVDLRLWVGTSAGKDLLWTLELDQGSYLVRLVNGDNPTAPADTTFNAHSVLSVGGRLYLRDVLWLKAGAGFAAFLQRAHGRGGDVIASSRRDGFALTGGGGYDLLRRHAFVLDLEVGGATAIFDHAAVWNGGIQLGFAWY